MEVFNMSNPTPRADLSNLKIDAEKRETRERSKTWLYLLLIIGCGVGIAGTQFFFKNTIPEVTTAIARQMESGYQSAILNASGYVTPRQRATIASKITGRIIELAVDEGMHVSENQVLARLDDSESREAVNAAQINLEVAQASISELTINLREAERNYTRIGSLFEQKMASEQTLDEAQTTLHALKARILVAQKQIKAAEAQLRIAKQNNDNYTITAPFSGIIVSKDAQIGEMVSPISSAGGFTRTGIATIVDMDSLEIEVDVNESYIARVTPGQKVDAVLDAYPGWKIPGRVRTVIPTADRQKATVKVRITFDTLDPRILPDMGVKVAFLENDSSRSDAESLKPVILIPRESIRNINGKIFVFVVNSDTVEQRAIMQGTVQGSDAEITAGLSGGETIVVKSSRELQNGQTVKLSEKIDF